MRILIKSFGSAALLALVTLLLPLAAGAKITPLSPELQAEAMMQYQRLDSLRRGKLPMSRFARPEFVHRQASLLLSSDRDPADIVVRRVRALWNDLSARGADVGMMKADLEALENECKATPVADQTARRDLYLKACALRRQVAFANPLLDFDDIVFIKHKKTLRDEPFGDHMAGQYYGINARKGNEGLFILNDAFGNPSETELVKGRLPDGAYLSPDLSFDGKKILFAYTEAAGYKPEVLAPEDVEYCYSYSGHSPSFTDKNAWHIYSINTDGSDLKQLSSGVFNDFDPCWLPSGKIAFISDRRGGFGRCHMQWDGGAPWFTYTLHRMNADGSDMERLSHHETCEWQPSVTNDGMILYTRWDYVDRGFFQAHHPWTTTPDGRNALAVHGNYPLNWRDRPCMELDLRAIPGSHRYVATAAPHHGQAYGSIVLINPEVEDDDAMSPVRLITPDERFPESEYGYFCREASYASPWPLSEDYYLCVFGHPDNSTEDHSVENYGIYLLDAFGNIELIHRDPEVACLSPIPLKARPTPPVISDIVQPMKVDMNQKRWNLARPEQLSQVKAVKKEYDPAVVSIINVYESRRQWPEGTKIAALRIIQVLPKTTPGRHNPAIGYGTEKNARAVLGTVPVEEDGSVYFYLPPYIPVYLQALDEQGKAVLSMRSDIYAAPKETLSCIGCHDTRRSAPPQQSLPLAMRRAPSTISPEMEGSNPFNYVRLVQPVLDRHCVECHSENPAAPDLSGEAGDGNWTTSYRSLQPYAFYYDGNGEFTESKTWPGKFGAIESKLYKHLAAGHKAVKLSDEEMRRLTLWLDCNSDFYGTYEHLEEQRSGETVHPIIE